MQGFTEGIGDIRHVSLVDACVAAIVDGAISEATGHIGYFADYLSKSP